MAMTAWCKGTPWPLIRPLTASPAAVCLSLTSLTKFPNTLPKLAPGSIGGTVWERPDAPSSLSSLKGMGLGATGWAPGLANGNVASSGAANAEMAESGLIQLDWLATLVIG